MINKINVKEFLDGIDTTNMVGYAEFAINAEDIIDKAKSMNNNNNENKNDLALCARIFCTYTPSYR